MADRTDDDPAAAATDRVLAAGGPGAYSRLVVARPPAGPAGDDLRRQIADLAAALSRTTSARSPGDAPAALAGVWLWHDFLDESHTISQGLQTPTGSFWHAVMHRREGDFSNAKYWYARCRRHPVLEELPARVAGVSGRGGSADPAVARVVRSGAWAPDAFVDLVERVHDNPGDPLHDVAVWLQRAEWQALFGHCLRAVSGNP